MGGGVGVVVLLSGLMYGDDGRCPHCCTLPVSRACTVYARVSCFTTLAPRQVLMQIAANSRSFSLYAKLGFEVKYGGF